MGNKRFFKYRWEGWMDFIISDLLVGNIKRNSIEYHSKYKDTHSTGFISEGWYWASSVMASLFIYRDTITWATQVYMTLSNLSIKLYYYPC